MANKRTHVAIVVVALCVIATLGVIGSLPTIVGLPSVKSAALEHVNRRIPGKLEIDDWSFGWFSGISVDGIKFSDESIVRRVEIDRVSVEAGLLAFLGKTKDLGAILISKPQIEIVVDGSEEGARGPGPVAERGAKDDSSIGKQISLPAVICRFELTDGTVSIRHDGTNAPFAEEVIAIACKADIDTVSRGAELNFLTVESSPVSLTCKGELTDWMGERDLRADGELSVDLDWLSKVAIAATGQKIVASGHRAGPFSVRTSLKGGSLDEIIEATVASASLYVERLEVLGIELGENRILSSISNGLATVSIDAPVNDGRLVLSPVLDLRGESPVLTHRENSRVLARVKPTKEMIDQLLARIHPVFKGCVFTAGSMTIDLQTLHVPSEDPVTGSVVEGKVYLHGVKLNASGLLNDVLEFSGIRERDIAIGEQRFGFEYRDGRMFPEPTTIRADGYVLIFSGSVGADQTLKYSVKIPVVPSMRSIIGRDGCELLKGQTFDIPITGTVARPRLDTKAFGKMLEELAKKGVSRLIEREAGKLLQDLFR